MRTFANGTFLFGWVPPQTGLTLTGWRLRTRRPRATTLCNKEDWMRTFRAGRVRSGQVRSGCRPEHPLRQGEDTYTTQSPTLRTQSDGTCGGGSATTSGTWHSRVSLDDRPRPTGLRCGRTASSDPFPSPPPACPYRMLEWAGWGWVGLGRVGLVWSGLAWLVGGGRRLLAKSPPARSRQKVRIPSRTPTSPGRVLRARGSGFALHVPRARLDASRGPDFPFQTQLPRWVRGGPSVLLRCGWISLRPANNTLPCLPAMPHGVEWPAVPCNSSIAYKSPTCEYRSHFDPGGSLAVRLCKPYRTVPYRTAPYRTVRILQSPAVWVRRRGPRGPSNTSVPVPGHGELCSMTQ